MVYLEDFLLEKGEVTIIGGSPLFDGGIEDAISINGFRSECKIAAINGNRSDNRRCIGKFDHVIAPNPKRKVPGTVIVPKNRVKMPDGFPGRQPTTYFALALICESLKIPTNIYGICGWASKWHYGDWEMFYMKHRTEYLKVYDPRTPW
jgi:hypothetical protein